MRNGYTILQVNGICDFVTTSYNDEKYLDVIVNDRGIFLKRGLKIKTKKHY